MRKLLYLLFLLLTLTGCDLITQFFSPSQTEVTSLITEFFSPSQKEASTCELEKKYYPVQTARYENQSQIYQLTLLDTPLCFKNPLTLSNVRLGRLSPEEKTEKAKLDYINSEDSTLYLSPGFPIEILSPKENAQNGGGSGFGSSLWVPLVAGAAGAALGNLAASRLSSPQYVSPPTPNGTGSLLQGFDDRQVSKTPPPSKSSSSYKDVAQKKKKSYSSFQPNKSSRKFKSKRRR